MMNVADRVIKLERKVQEILSKLMNIRAIATTLGHHATHEAGGADPIKLDDLAAPDDNTDLDVTVGHHGLAPKRDGDAQHALLGDATWGHPKGLLHQADHRSGGADALALDKLAAPADDTDDTLLSTIARKGLLDKLPNDDTLYMDGIGNWSAPAGGAGGGAPADALYIVGAADGDLSAERVKAALYVNFDLDDYPGAPNALDDEFDDGSVDVKWTLANGPGGADDPVESAFPGFLSAGMPEDAGTANTYAKLILLTQAAPAGNALAEYIAKVAIGNDGIGGTFGKFGGCGIILADSANLDCIAICYQITDSSTSGRASIAGFYITGGVITTFTVTQTNYINQGLWLYLKLKKSTNAAYTSANTYDVFYSFNGIVWVQCGTISKTFTANCDKVGLLFRKPDSQTGTAHATAAVDFFRRTI